MEHRKIDVAVFGYTEIDVDGKPVANVLPSRQATESSFLSTHEYYSRALFTFTNPSLWNKIWNREFFSWEISQFRSGLDWADDLPFTFSGLARAQRPMILREPHYHYRVAVAGSQTEQFRRAEDLDCIIRALDVLFGLLEKKGNLMRFGEAFNSFALSQLKRALRGLPMKKEKNFSPTQGPLCQYSPKRTVLSM